MALTIRQYLPIDIMMRKNINFNNGNRDLSKLFTVNIVYSDSTYKCLSQVWISYKVSSYNIIPMSAIY